MSTQATNNLVTISKRSIQKKGGMVVLPVEEYNKLKERAVPTYYLKDKQAKYLDKEVDQGLKDYKSGKCKKIQTFPVILQKDEGSGYVVTNPAIEGCYSQGDNIEEALYNIKEATELCIEETKGQYKKMKAKNVSLRLISVKNKYV